jgi:hypothetical protein
MQARAGRGDGGLDEQRLRVAQDHRPKCRLAGLFDQIGGSPDERRPRDLAHRAERRDGAAEEDALADHPLRADRGDLDALALGRLGDDADDRIGGEVELGDGLPGTGEGLPVPKLAKLEHSDKPG